MVSYWFFGNEVVMAMGILLANEAMVLCFLHNVTRRHPSNTPSPPQSDWSNFIITPIIASEWSPKLSPWFGPYLSTKIGIGSLTV